jgi:hypothetical protein
VTSDTPESSAIIKIENYRTWFGDQRLGAFRIALDAQKAGVILPGQSLELSVAPGPHVLRLRQWWYQSQPITVDVHPSEWVRLNADVVRSGGPMHRFLTLLFRPSRGLALVRRPDDPT